MWARLETGMDHAALTLPPLPHALAVLRRQLVILERTLRCNDPGHGLSLGHPPIDERAAHSGDQVSPPSPVDSLDVGPGGTTGHFAGPPARAYSVWAALPAPSVS